MREREKEKQEEIEKAKGRTNDRIDLALSAE